jgi:hypothetical protein
LFPRVRLQVLYPEGKHGTTPKKADQARGIESKDSPDKNYPNQVLVSQDSQFGTSRERIYELPRECQDRIDGFGESPSQKTIKLKVVPTGEPKHNLTRTLPL